MGVFGMRMNGTPTDLHIRRYSTRSVDDAWEELLPLLERGRVAWEEYYTLEEIRNGLAEGRMQFWSMDRVSEEKPFLGFITTLEMYTQKRSLRIMWLGGERFAEAMGMMFSTVEAWARTLGCKNMEVVGRGGFERLLQPLGYKRTHVILTKEL